jgi:hypothetical protein
LKGFIVEVIYVIVRFFAAGGLFMFPILLVAAIGAAIAVERYVTLTRVQVRNRSVWNQVQPVLVEGDFDKAREMTSKNDSAIAQLLSIGLARQGAVRRRDARNPRVLLEASGHVLEVLTLRDAHTADVDTEHVGDVEGAGECLPRGEEQQGHCKGESHCFGVRPHGYVIGRSAVGRLSVPLAGRASSA